MQHNIQYPSIPDTYYPQQQQQQYNPYYPQPQYNLYYMQQSIESMKAEIRAMQMQIQELMRVVKK